MTLAIPESQLQELKLAAAHDPVLQALNKTIQLGWPDFKSILPKVVHCYMYFDVHDELTVQDELVFKRVQIVIPSSLRKRMMKSVHKSHTGIDGYVHRAKERVPWPQMS